MLPKLKADNFEGIELIRPLYYVEEEAIKRFIKYTGCLLYTSFYYLESFNGNTDHAVLGYILRDHDENKLESKKATLKLIEKLLNEKYGEGTVKLTITDQYKNMAEHVRCV